MSYSTSIPCYARGTSNWGEAAHLGCNVSHRRYPIRCKRIRRWGRGDCIKPRLVLYFLSSPLVVRVEGSYPLGDPKGEGLVEGRIDAGSSTAFEFFITFIRFDFFNDLFLA